MPEFVLRPAADVPPAALHAAFGAAFADYLLGPFTMPPGAWPSFLGRQCIAIDQSRVAMVDGAIAAFALAAPRPDQLSWRLGTMGALPAARGTGAAPALLDDFIARAQAAGQQRVELECFAQNERGLRLYRSRGFEAVDALYGYAGTLAGRACADVEALPLEAAFTRLHALAIDLPLQVTPASLRTLSPGLAAWRCGTALAVAAASADKLTLHSLVDVDPAQADAERLVAHLAALHAGCSLHVPQLLRDAAGGSALQRLGVPRLPLHQLWMRRSAG